MKAATDSPEQDTLDWAGFDAHAETCDRVLEVLGASRHGLTQAEAAARLESYGSNALPRPRPPGLLEVFVHQFASPLIYVLVVAAVVSLVIQEWSDALFIGAVLLVNAVIGTFQEYSAQRAAEALHRLVTTRSRVLREGDAYELDAEALVPGDIVLLESGDRIPADLRLLSGRDLEVDESLLTGESLAVLKDATRTLAPDSVLGDRVNMAFAGTLVNRGRGRGVVVGTGLHTQLGRIATEVLRKRTTKAPLLVRMERFTHRVAAIVAVTALLMAVVALYQGMPLEEVFLLAVALAVSAVPEGLPVALTVALAIGMQRMARRNVIVRRLVAVEALGSCTCIATDKTGTLTENRLTVRRILFPGMEEWEVTGESLVPTGAILAPRGALSPQDQERLARLCQAAVLANEGFLGHQDSGWVYQGDAVDVALLVMAHKAGVRQAETISTLPELASIPFESERQFCASLNEIDGVAYASVKGALERILPFCDHMLASSGTQAIDAQILEDQAHTLASRGYRVIAIAAGPIQAELQAPFTDVRLHGLTLLGLVGLIDPLRASAKSAVTACREAGIEVAMLTGDHPTTAYAIAEELGLARDRQQVTTGPELKAAASDSELDVLTRQARVFARVEPQQKLAIVRSLQRNGHYVAVSGDGANDAPALRAAEVGVAMGRSGTDVARETAELIITDDDFASIVAGVEEGRVAYANVRKVIFLLISTGAAELVLFTLALLTGLPLPLLAVQLLWLNLVTNGIQDVALAFEPGEGGELRRPPRPPRESIFNRLMVERVVLSATVMGVVAFALFQYLLSNGYTLEAARNATLILMVLFENVHVFNSRSEMRSAFRHNPLRNPLLLFGTLAAQMVHIGAMYTPWINDVLGIQPVSPGDWLIFLGMALTVLLAMEMHKAVKQWVGRRGSDFGA
jgi:magnesium-transporting ATPase (P-type)